MKPLYLRVYFKNAKVEIKAEKVKVVCPNEYGGVGNLIIEDKVQFWDGDWFTVKNLTAQFSDVTQIDYSFGMDDETPWINFFLLPINYKFTYGFWNNLAIKLNKMLEENI